VLQKTLAFVSDDDSAPVTSALPSAMSQGAARPTPPPTMLADVPASAAPVQYAIGQLLLLLPDGPACPPQLCRVTEGGRVLRLTDAASVATPLEACSQAVLPWRRGAQEQAAAIVAIMEPLWIKPAACGQGTKQATQAGKDIMKAASLQPSAVQAVLKRAPSTDVRLGGTVEQRNLEIIAAEAWRAIGAIGTREYAIGQRLMVRHGGGWRDAEVVGERNRIDGEDMPLHPWNHTPSDLPVSAFDALREWHAQTLRAEHSHIVDALSGNRLNVMDQCVAIEVASTSEMAGVGDAGGLAEWLHSLHANCCEGNDVSQPACCALLTGRPAAGKTSLLSQVIIHSLARANSELVPILVKVQVLQARLLKNETDFAAAWNWVDALLCLEHGAGSALYRMLRQAMLARRALFLLDGLDEGGEARGRIEEHVTQVLALQGHVIFATSRPLPPGPSETRFQHFHRLQLSPLTDVQQQRALEQRLGSTRAAKLLPFLQDKVPVDETNQKITANPLMLSMVASIFELRQGLAMPESVVGLYDEATKAMLARGSKDGGARQLDLLRLVMAVFFRAHVAMERVITLKHLQAAAREVKGGEAMLRELRERVVQDRMPLLSLLQVQSAHLSFQEYFAARAVCEGATLPTQPWLLPSFWRNAVDLGLQMGDAFGRGLFRAGNAKLESASVQVVLGGDTQVAANALGAALGCASAVKQVRVGQVSLSLAELRQKTMVDLSGKNLGDVGLLLLGRFLQFASMSDELPLHTLKLARTSISTVEAVAALWRVPSLTEIDVSENGVLKLSGKIDVPLDATVLNLDNTGLGDGGVTLLAGLLRCSGSLANLKGLCLGRNQIGDEGMKVFSEAIGKGSLANLTRLYLDNNRIGDSGMQAFASAVASGSLANLERLDLDENEIGDDSMEAFSSAIANGSLANLEGLELSGNQIGDAGMIELSRQIASGVMANLNELRLDDNQIGDDGMKAFSAAIGSGSLAQLRSLNLVRNQISDPGMASFADAIAKGSLANLNNLYLGGNQIGDAGMTALAGASGSLPALQQVDLFGNPGSDAPVKNALAERKK